MGIDILYIVCNMYLNDIKGGDYMQDKKPARLVLNITEEKRREIKAHAGAVGKTMAEVVVEAFDFMKKQGGKDEQRSGLS